MKISLIQMNSGGDKENNFKKAHKFINRAAANNSDLACLPENFLYWGKENVKYAEEPESKNISAFKKLAKDNNINIILGSIALKSKIPGKITNTSLVINRNGKIIHRYEKIYMYDVIRPDFSFRESNNTVRGKSLGFFKLDGIKMGVGICVDLRYPEYFRALVKKGAEIIFLPSHFYKATGEIAWDVLTRARAIENQAYFCACGQTGVAGNRERCGKTRIVSYTGEILKELKTGEGIMSAELEMDNQRKFRKEFPVLKQINKK